MTFLEFLYKSISYRKAVCSWHLSLIWTVQTWFKHCRISMFAQTAEHLIKHLNTSKSRTSDASYQGSTTKWIWKSQDSLFWTLTVVSLDSCLHIYSVYTNLTWHLTFLCICSKVKVFMFAFLTDNYPLTPLLTHAEVVKGPLVLWRCQSIKGIWTFVSINPSFGSEDNDSELIWWEVFDFNHNSEIYSIISITFIKKKCSIGAGQLI